MNTSRPIVLPNKPYMEPTPVTKARFFRVDCGAAQLNRYVLGGNDA
jgi:hypothetical protein